MTKEQLHRGNLSYDYCDLTIVEFDYCEMTIVKWLLWNDYCDLNIV